jgi:hypothetical protein
MFGAVFEIGIRVAVLCSVFCSGPAGLVAAFLAGVAVCALTGGFCPDTMAAATAIETPSTDKRLNPAEFIPSLLK